MIELVGVQLNQWDVDRVVKVTGEASHVHFANQGDSKAVIMNIVGGEAKIPNYLLQTGKALHAYAVRNGVTMEIKVFAVRKRERPENYIYEDDQRNYIYDLTNRVEEAIGAAKPHILTVKTVMTDIGGITNVEEKPVPFNWDETVAAINNNRLVMAHHLITNKFYPLVQADLDAGVLYFISAMYYEDSPIVEGFVIYADGTLNIYGYGIDHDTVNEKLGDIETALDAIIAMQKELIGV